MTHWSLVLHIFDVGPDVYLSKYMSWNIKTKKPRYLNTNWPQNAHTREYDSVNNLADSINTNRSPIYFDGKSQEAASDWAYLLVCGVSNRTENTNTAEY